MPKVTKAQIDIWKKKYAGIYELIVEDKKAYLRKPDRNTLRLAFSKAATDPLGWPKWCSLIVGLVVMTK